MGLGKMLVSLVLAACLPAAVHACPDDGASDAVTPAPIIVVLYIDDMNTDIDLPNVHATHIDALAASGVRFSRAYAGHSVCSPSRTSLLSGQHTIHTEVFHNADNVPAQVNGVPYLPRRLRDAGYYCAGVGKIFHKQTAAIAGNWDEYTDFADDVGISQPEVPHTPESAGIVIGGPFLNGPTGALGKQADTKRTDKALGLLAAAKHRLSITGKPTAIFIGWEATHEPFVYPESYSDLYDLNDVPTLPAEETALPWKSSVNHQSHATYWFYDPKWGVTEAERRQQALLTYFRCLTYLDDQVGRVLDGLVSTGLAEDAIVVLVSDHGYSFSQHDHIGKTRGFDEDIRAPLVIRVPSMPATHGQSVDTPVSQLDIYPTLMELLGLPVDATLDGESLLPLLADPGAEHGPVFYSTEENAGFNLTRYVVQRDAVTGAVWKLAAWEHDDTIPQVHQLYDLSSDPGEYLNLATDPLQAAKQAELRQALEGVHLLGPLARHFGNGVAGTSGVPDISWIGTPALGSDGVLEIDNSSGEPTFALLSVGFSAWPMPVKGLLIQAAFFVPLTLASDGLSLSIGLPADAMLDEFPLGLQILLADSGAAKGVAASRGLSLFLAH